MKHQTISFVKSGVRIAGYGLLCYNPLLAIAASVLIVSEVIGIVEEIGHE